MPPHPSSASPDIGIEILERACARLDASLPPATVAALRELAAQGRLADVDAIQTILESALDAH